MAAIRHLNIALLSALAIAPAAFAQDATTDTAAHKRFAVIGGYAIQQPASDPIEDSRLDIDGGSAATLSANWYITPAIAVELWGAADKFEHRVRGDEGRIGNIDSQPLAVSAQYHFLASDAPIRPFVGLGYYQTNYSGGYNIVDDANQHFGLQDAKGAIGTVGVDFNVSPSWFVRADARYMHGSSDVTFNGQGSGVEADMNPWTVGLGIGGRF